MKTTKLKNHIQPKLVALVILLLPVFFIGACSKKARFPVSSVVPAAEGYVKVKEDKNENYSIEVKVEHLADPKRLNPPKNTYVVWIETDRGRTENIGQLKSSGNFLSNKRKGSLETVSPYKPREVFITAEDNANVQYPGMQEVLRTDIE